MSHRNTPASFWERVDQTGGCWNWRLSVKKADGCQLPPIETGGLHLGEDMSPCHSSGTQLPVHRRPVYRAALGGLTAFRPEGASRRACLIHQPGGDCSRSPWPAKLLAETPALPGKTREENNAACWKPAEASQATGRTDLCAIPQPSRRLEIQASSLSEGRIPPPAEARGSPSRRTREAFLMDRPNIRDEPTARTSLPIS